MSLHEILAHKGNVHNIPSGFKIEEHKGFKAGYGILEKLLLKIQ